ncbi:MAG: hypothetical protein NT010_08615 [Proteobacteria bacterium]|nr:hypothetical protein [Pseudomonadota bacterium]
MSTNRGYPPKVGAGIEHTTYPLVEYHSREQKSIPATLKERI